MSKPKFMVFKLKDLWVPIIITIFAVIMVVFFISRFTATKATFSPDEAFNDGLYVTEIALDNANFNVAVSIHKNSIKSVELRNMDEEAKLMYPLFEPSIAFINEEVTKTQSLEIGEFEPAKETTEFLMSAVRDALSLNEETVDMPEEHIEDYIITEPVSHSIDNPEMSDEVYIDWESELDGLFEDEVDEVD